MATITTHGLLCRCHCGQEIWVKIHGQWGATVWCFYNADEEAPAPAGPLTLCPACGEKLTFDDLQPYERR